MMEKIVGSICYGTDRFGKYIAIKAEGYCMQIFRDYLDTPKEIIKAYEKYHNVIGVVEWYEVV